MQILDLICKNCGCKYSVDVLKHSVIRYYNGHEVQVSDIECPECGKQIYVNVERVLLSNPPKNEYKCLFCGWKGVG